MCTMIYIFFTVVPEGIMEHGTSLHEVTATPCELEAKECACKVSIQYNNSNIYVGRDAKVQLDK